MENSFSKPYSYSRAILAGFLLSMLALGLSFASLEIPKYFNQDDNEGRESGFRVLDWNFTDPEAFILSLEENLPKLFFTQIQVGIVTQGEDENTEWDFTPSGFFQNNIHRIVIEGRVKDDLLSTPIFVSDNLTPDEWLTRPWNIITTDITNEKDSRQLANETIILQDLSTALKNDITSLSNLENITSIQGEEFAKLRSTEGIHYWSITHGYTDGHLIQIELFDDVIVIRQFTINFIVYESNQFNIIRNPDLVTPTFRSFHSKNELSSYTLAINSIILGQT